MILDIGVTQAVFIVFCRSSDGLLLLTGDSSFIDHLAIRLINGRVSFSLLNFGGDLSAVTSDLYNDSAIHNLQFTRFMRNINFTLDGREQPAIDGFAGKQTINVAT